MFVASNNNKYNAMKLNGIELTKKEELNLYRREKRQLEKEIITEAVHNELCYLGKRINKLSTELKIESLEAKRDKVRSATEYDKIGNQIDKLRSSL